MLVEEEPQERSVRLVSTSAQVGDPLRVTVPGAEVEGRIEAVESPTLHVRIGRRLFLWFANIPIAVPITSQRVAAYPVRRSSDDVDDWIALERKTRNGYGDVRAGKCSHGVSRKNAVDGTHARGPETETGLRRVRRSRLVTPGVLARAAHPAPRRPALARSSRPPLLVDATPRSSDRS